MVRLCRGETATLVKERLQRIIRNIAAPDDPALDIGAATGVVLAVSMELVVRMRRFAGYPAALCRMSKRWFPATAVANVHEFLSTDPMQRDVGAGLQIHTHAWQCGETEVATAAWLLEPSARSCLTYW